MEILYVYKNQPIKSFITFLMMLLGIITFLFYQEIEIKSITSVIEVFTSEEDKSVLYLTWILNLLCLFGFNVLGVAWIKDSFKQQNDYYYDVENNVIKIVIGIAMGIFLIACSMFFIVYLFNKLIGLIIVVALFLCYFYTENQSTK